MKNLTRAVVFSAVFAVGQACAGEDVDAAWRLLFENKFVEAGKAFSSLKPETFEAKLATLEGAYIAAQMRGDEIAVYDIAKEQLRIAFAMKDSTVAMKFYRRYDTRVGNLKRGEDDFSFKKELYKSECHPMVRLYIRNDLKRCYYSRRMFSEFDAIRKGDSVVDNYAAIIGPFRDYKGIQDDEVLSPEIDLGKDEYVDGRGDKISVYKDVKPSKWSHVDISRIFPEGRSGTCYIVVIVNSDRDRSVVCGFSGSKAWLNGIQVYDRDAYWREPRNVDRRVIVKLKKGDNVLVSRQGHSYGASISFAQLDGGPAKGLVYKKYDAKLLSASPCRNTFGYIASKRYLDPLVDDFNKLSGAGAALDFWLANSYFRIGKPQEMRAVWDRLLEKYPKSVCVLVYAALSRISEKYQSGDSGERLTKEMLDILQRAKKIAPDNFAVRMELARNYQRTDQTEQALELFRKVQEDYPENLSVRKELAEIYKKKNWQALAESAYRDMTKQEPGYDLLLAGFYEDNGKKKMADDIYKKAWGERRIGYYHMYNYYKGIAEWGKARNLVEEWARDSDYSARWLRNKKLELAVGAGDKKEVERLLVEAAESDSEDIGKAKRVAEFMVKEGRKDDALKWFVEADRRAAVDENVDVELRRRIRKLKGGEWDLLGYDLKLDEIDHKKVVKKDHPRANYAHLLRVNVTRIYEDRSSESLQHYAIKVFDKNGIGQLSEMSVPQGSDNLLFCRTVQPDGSVFVPTSVENLQLGKATSMYNVQEGSILEYAFRSVNGGGRNNDWYDNFQVEFDDVPIIRTRYVVIVPTSLTSGLSMKIYPKDLLPKVTEKDGLVTYSWDIGERKGLKPEYFIPDDEEVYSNISLSLVGKHYLGKSHFFRRLEPIRSNDEIVAKAKEIVGSEKDVRRQVQMIYSWIVKDIKDARGAETARDVMYLKSGGSQAKLRLLRAMLDSLGVKSYYTAVNRSLTTAGSTRKRRASASGSFGYPRLLHVVVPDGLDVWLQFSDPARYSRMADIGQMLGGAYAIERYNGGLRSVRVRGEFGGEWHSLESKVWLNPDCSAKVEIDFSLNGAAAAQFRNLAERPQQGPIFMERMASRFFRGITVDKVDYPKPDTKNRGILPEREAFGYRCSGKVSNLCRNEGEALSFRPFQSDVMAKNLITELPRKHPFDISRDVVQSDRMEYYAPEGWAFAKVSEDIWWQNEHGLYMHDYNVDGNRLIVTRMFIVLAHKMDAEEYTAFHAWLGEIEKMNRLSVSIEKLPEMAEKTAVYREGAFRVVETSKFTPRYWPENLSVDGEDKKE